MISIPLSPHKLLLTSAKTTSWQKGAFCAYSWVRFRLRVGPRLHQTPSRWIALLFTSRARDSKVSLLPSYARFQVVNSSGSLPFQVLLNISIIACLPLLTIITLYEVFEFYSYKWQSFVFSSDINGIYPFLPLFLEACVCNLRPDPF